MRHPRYWSRLDLPSLGVLNISPAFSEESAFGESRDSILPMHIPLFFAHAGLVLARIRSEERLLAEQFGSEYESYCTRTWRLLPGIY